MSLCYDGKKWAMISLSLSAATIVIGLVFMQVGHGQGFDINELQTITSYCFLHADSANPINDLVRQGLVDPYWKDWTCGNVSDILDRELQKQARNEESAAQEKLDFK
jgi:hypothetical protein